MADGVLGTLDQFTTARPLIKGYPNWIGDIQEQARIASYQLYESIYWTVPEAFKLISRGKEDKPVYIPSARIIVETLHRFLAPKFSVIEDPTLGTTQDQELAHQVMTDFARRERLYSKFTANKRYGIIRGDWLFYLQGDPLRAPGTRVSIFPIDPGSFFWIYNEENIDEIIGAHVVNQYMIGNKPHIKRETWLKTTGTAGPSPISYEAAVFKLDEWGGPGVELKAPQLTLTPPTMLPAPIDDLPFYHIPNFEEPQAIWGSSELRGLETVISKISQNASDEDLAIALEALGVYATTAGTPVDDDGNEVAWNIGPGRVVELPATDGGSLRDLFDRISGVSSVAPYQDHLRYLGEQLDLAVGQPAIAKGKVDVTVAESGIALLLEMGPLLATAEEKENIVTDVTTQMLFNLPKWIIAYEGTMFNSLLEVTRWLPKFGDRLPQNKDKQFDQLMTLLNSTKPVVSSRYVRRRLVSIGWDPDMPDDATMETEMAEESQAGVDAAGLRVAGELSNMASQGAPPDTDGDTGAADAGV